MVTILDLMKYRKEAQFMVKLLNLENLNKLDVYNYFTLEDDEELFDIFNLELITKRCLDSLLLCYKPFIPALRRKDIVTKRYRKGPYEVSIAFLAPVANNKTWIKICGTSLRDNKV